MNLTRDELILAILNDPNATERERMCIDALESDEGLENDEIGSLQQTVDQQADEIKGLENEVARLETVIAEYELLTEYKCIACGHEYDSKGGSFGENCPKCGCDGTQRWLDEHGGKRK